LGLTLSLDSDVRFVRGVGPGRAGAFASLGVHTVADLIEYFPFRHETIPQSRPIGELELDAVATIVGEVRRVRTGGQAWRPIITATVEDATGRLKCRWFNSSYLKDKLHHGLVVRLSGKVELVGDDAGMTNPSVTLFDDDEDPFVDDEDRYVPIYSASAQLPSKQIQQVMEKLLPEVESLIAEFLPDQLRAKRHLPPRPTCVLRYHQPASLSDVAVARQRLAYEELVLCRLAVELSRRCRMRSAKARPIVVTNEIDRRIRKRFPFSLTRGQDRAVVDIRADLAKPSPMNRLLMADVGAGKTVIAFYTCMAAIARRAQAAILAPTEVLASQHFQKIGQYLEGSRVCVEFLTGSTTAPRRRDILQGLADGRIDFLIGTHAVLEGDVAFHELGVVIIDEQHKFGVAQRAALRRKATAPHVLVLTATPIPRTLAMTAFGDLEVSCIEGLPPGRQPVDTRMVSPQLERDAWTFVRRRLEQGERSFVVYPLVEDSEALPLKSARSQVEQLAATHLSGCRIDLLHGRMKSSEKQEVMERFKSGDTQVLVSTTVIEVGVDVPEATIMIIQHADRYGLSQLHQLRGRIGRGSRKSYCFLFADEAGEIARERLEILCRTNDGFRIAEEDLRLRGPGELLGTRQHGMPEFKVANLATDLPLIRLAQEDAGQLLQEDAELKDPRHELLRRELARRYGEVIGFMDVA